MKATWRTKCLAGIICSAIAFGAENMIGRQSHNIGLLVLPAKGRVAIDGDLSDWDWSGRIWIFADKLVRSRYSAEVGAMWDKDNLYLAAKWKDPTPMFSDVDPNFNPNDGWKSDSWQMRIVTDRTLWVTTWYYAAKKMPIMHFAFWKDPRNARGGTDEFLLRTTEGGSELGQGAAMKYKVDADGNGCVQEARIPWKLLYKELPEVKPGFTLQLGNEFLWGDPTGKTWPIHRYADNFKPGHTSREFYWTNYRVWGEAKLVAEGNVEPRQYIDDSGKLAGTIPIRFDLPRDAARFTVVIEDEQGKRVRNLTGDFDPADYAVKDNGDTVTVEVLWDGLTDKVWSGNHREGYKGAGQLVSKGTYKVRGLYHRGLGAEYEMCFYNPGTPPWPTAKGSGGWGADHSPPADIARSGDWMILTWSVVEGGCGIIGIGPDGKRKWGEKRGAIRVTANEKYVFALAGHTFHSKGWNNLIRLDKKKGTYQPFVVDGKKRPFDLNPATLLPEGFEGQVNDLAASESLLVLALSDGRLAVLDPESAELKKLIEIESPQRIALADASTLYAISNGKFVRVDVASGKIEGVPITGVGDAKDIAADGHGNLLTADNGPAKQVKAFSAQGKLAYACGKEGGRPARGKFDPQAIFAFRNIDVDSKGNVWVVEDTNLPRRLSVWGKDGSAGLTAGGKLVRDYVGNTGYAGTSTYLHNTDPTLGYYGPVEMKLDKATRSWKVTQILWVPDKNTPGETFAISHGSHVQPTRFTSDASGQPREYLHSPQGWQVVYMPIDGQWQPVSAVCHVVNISGKMTRHGMVEEKPSGEWADLNAKDGVFWTDKNRDGRVQRAECTIVETESPADPENRDRRKRRGELALAVRSGWGGRMGKDLSFYASDRWGNLMQYTPAGFTADGAPIYTPESMKKLRINETGDLVPVIEEDLLLCLSWKGYAGPTRLLGIDTREGRVAWKYPNPYPGVHGSHRATMPKPGMLIGPLKTLGVVKVNDEVGRVFAMRGNLGSDFYMTTDGLFVGALFVDGRLPGLSLPDKEEQLAGMPMESFTVGGEPFSGTLVKQTDGVIRTTTGMPRQACMILQVKGLETIRRFTVGSIVVDGARLAKVRADIEARSLATSEPEKKEYAIRRAPAGAAADGRQDDWKGIPRLNIVREGTPERASARLMWDETHLYLEFSVNDMSPWRNEGKDFGRLFKTGDAVDVQLSPSANKRRNPIEGDLRLVISQLNRRPVVVLMKPKDKSADQAAAKTYSSPVMSHPFARVQVVAEAKVKVIKRSTSYTVEAAIPLKTIGLSLKKGQILRGDLGFISSDAGGRINTARTYWSNKQTNLVNDEPSEAWLYPEQWGELRVE